MNETTPGSVPDRSLPIQLPPTVIAHFQDQQQQQPQQWQYIHRVHSRSKIGLGVSQRTGRVQWCPGMTCCKLLIIIPVIMLPVIVILLLLMRMDGLMSTLSRNDGSMKEQQQPLFYDDDYIDDMAYVMENQQLNRRLSDEIVNDRDEIDRLRRCISFRFQLSEKNDIEDHDILKDARTSFVPLDTTAIPRECLKHEKRFSHAIDYNELLKSALRKRQRRTPNGEEVDIPSTEHPTSDYEYDIDDDGVSNYSEELDDPKLIEMVSELRNFWGDKSSKETIRNTQARTMMQYMDPRVDPCTDFYKFACGNWANVHPIPRDKAGFDTFEMLREHLDLILRDLLENNGEAPKTNKRAYQKVVDVPSNDFEPHGNTQADIVPQILKEAEPDKSEQKQKLIDHIVSKRAILERILRRYRRESMMRTRRLMKVRNRNVDDEDAIRKTRDFYRSCTNVRLIQKRGIDPLLSLIHRLGGWPVLDAGWDASRFDWLNLTAQLRRFNNDIFIVEWVGPDIKSSDENIIQFDQTSLGLPTREYFLQEANSKYLRAYQTFMTAIMLGLGARSPDAERSAAELIAFETRLAFITAPAEQRLNVTKLYKRMTLDNLQKTVPRIDWIRYLSILQERPVQRNEEVVIFALDYMHRLVSLIESTDQRIVSNYLLWRFLRHRINNVDDRFESSKQSFYHTLFGREESPSRWKICIAQVNTNMGMALGSLFVRRYFDENSKKDTLEMTREVQQSFRDMLKTANWLDPMTKQLAELKVNAMSLKIGYPDFILNRKELNKNYEGIVIHPDFYFENTLNVLLHTARTEQQRLNEHVNKTTWQTAPAIVNAYYSRNKNQIMFPAGILQPPFYHRHFPRSLNFGGIGVVIGHELTHGFDDKGRLFDRNGSIHKWWSDSSIRGFDERARCIISQYSNYTVEEIGVTLNGESTQGENIADNGGLRQAFHAYKRWLRENPAAAADEVLPGMNMTSKQLFFLNFGQVWCGAMRPEAVRNKLNTAIHSPGRFRVIGSVSNSVDFANEFSCAIGTPMNPLRKCSVW